MLALMLALLIWSISVTQELEADTAALEQDTAELQADIEFLTEEFANFEPETIQVGEIDRELGVEWVQGSTCFSEGVERAITSSTELWSIDNGNAPDGFQSQYDGAPQEVPFGGTGVPLNEDNCLVFDGFLQKYPLIMLRHLDRQPCTELVNVTFRINVRAEDKTFPNRPRTTDITVLTTEPFTIPAAPSC